MPKASTDLDDTLQFMRSLWELDHALQSRSKAMISLLGITGPQRFALRLIGQHPGISSGELSALMHLHPSTLTGLLQRLVDRSFVSRANDPADGRRALFTLTPSGKKAARDNQVCIEAVVRDVLEDFEATHLSDAQRLIGELAQKLLEVPSTRKKR